MLRRLADYVLAALVTSLSLSGAAEAQTSAARASESERISNLNRSGRWDEAASSAQKYLAGASGRMSRIVRCDVQMDLAYAHMRLGHADSARAQLTAIERGCKSKGEYIIAQGAAQIAGMRKELNELGRGVGSGNGFSAPVTQPTPTAAARRILPRLDPEAAGLNTTALSEHRSLCERTGADACIVLYKGQVVQEWTGPAYRRPIYGMSATKSITGLLVGMLLADGKIKSIDERVCTYLKSWCTGARGEVTLRHLLTMTSGLPLRSDSSVGLVRDKNAFVIAQRPVAKPGTTWAYSNEGVQLLSPILDAAAGEPVQKYAQRRLFKPLGLTNTRLHVDTKGKAWTYADMETTPEEFAIIGQMMLQRGVWNGKRLISDAWITASTKPSQTLKQNYGLLWWLHDSPRGYAAEGFLDTDIHVFPDLELVVVRMQAKEFAGASDGTYERAALPLYRKIVPQNGGEQK